jgi:hypothetical protein
MLKIQLKYTSSFLFGLGSVFLEKKCQDANSREKAQHSEKRERNKIKQISSLTIHITFSKQAYHNENRI